MDLSLADLLLLRDSLMDTDMLHALKDEDLTDDQYAMIARLNAEITVKEFQASQDPR